MASAWTPIAAGKIVTHASERLDHDANSRRTVDAPVAKVVQSGDPDARQLKNRMGRMAQTAGAIRSRCGPTHDSTRLLTHDDAIWIVATCSPFIARF